MEFIQDNYNNVRSWNLTINGYYDANNTAETPITVLAAENTTMSSRRKPQISVPISMSRLRKYRWEITKVAMSTL